MLPVVYSDNPRLKAADVEVRRRPRPSLQTGLAEDLLGVPSSANRRRLRPAATSQSSNLFGGLPKQCPREFWGSGGEP